MLFTYNRAFSKDDVVTPLLEKYDIERWRIVMIEQKKGENKVYATESSDMVSTFFRYNKLKKDEFILSDGGVSF